MTGVQTCALPISSEKGNSALLSAGRAWLAKALPFSALESSVFASEAFRPSLTLPLLRESERGRKRGQAEAAWHGNMESHSEVRVSMCGCPWRKKGGHWKVCRCISMKASQV